MILRYALLWLASFVAISAVDALWHLVLWGRLYGAGIRRVAAVIDGKPALHNGSGLAAQVLVITAFVVLASLQFSGGAAATGRIVLSCVMGGVLGISVYGLVNHWLVRDWSAVMTVLEVVWGPVLGAFAGFFIAWAGRLLKVY
jgi:uncharacterized membrane protein